MIKFKFMAGFVAGIIIVFALTYAVGTTLEAMSISLYDSESDQQRNFNIYIVCSLAVALLTGYIATRVGEKNNK